MMEGFDKDGSKPVSATFTAGVPSGPSTHPGDGDEDNAADTFKHKAIGDAGTDWSVGSTPVSAAGPSSSSSLPVPACPPSSSASLLPSASATPPHIAPPSTLMAPSPLWSDDGGGGGSDADDDNSDPLMHHRNKGKGKPASAAEAAARPPACAPTAADLPPRAAPAPVCGGGRGGVAAGMGLGGGGGAWATADGRSSPPLSAARHPVVHSLAQDAIKEMVERTFRRARCAEGEGMTEEQFARVVEADENLLAW